MDSSFSSRRRAPLRDLDGGGGYDDDDDIEEGEYVPGRHESFVDDTDGYRLKRRLEAELGRRVSWEEVALASGRRVAAPGSLARSSCESDGTISDDGNDNNPSADSSDAVISSDGAARRFACHVCGRGFSSAKAVDGHMRVHGNGRMAPAAPAVVGGGWAATGKRVLTGGKPSVAAASLNSESTADADHSVVAQPMPMAIAVTNPSSTPVLSTGTNLSGEESSSSATAQPMDYEPPAVATVVTGPNPSTGTVVHHQPPPPAAEQARPDHQPAVPQPQSRVVQQPLVPAAAARLAEPPRVYSCKLCGKSYSSHQGLGGHAAGHRNREKEAEAAAAAAAAAAGMMTGLGHDDGGALLPALRRGRRAEEPHECQKCHKVFATGVALGGHMRMHYTGPPIVHRRSKRRCVVALSPAPAVSEADLRLALSTVTEERRPSPAPAVAAGRVRLFGIDIGPQVQAPPSSKEEEEEEGSGTADGSSCEGETAEKQ